MAKGDLLLCYLSSPDSAFVGVQEVVGAMRDGGSVVWGKQYPLALDVRSLAVLEPEEAVRYVTLNFLPTMAGREAGRAVPCRAAGASVSQPTAFRLQRASVWWMPS